MKCLPVTGDGHLGWPWEGLRWRRFPGELWARERDRRPRPVSSKKARLRELVVGAEPPRGPVMTWHRITHKHGRPFVPAHVIGSVVGDRPTGAHARGFSRLLVSLPFAEHCGGGRDRRLLTRL